VIHRGRLIMSDLMNRVRHRHPGMHFGPFSRLSADSESAFHEMNSFFHADESQSGRGNSVRILRESFSIVPDTHPHPIRRTQESDQHIRGLGMCLDILEGFLCHTVQTGGSVDRKGLRNVSSHMPDRQSGAPSEFVDMVSNGHIQAKMLKKGGVQSVGKVVDVISKLHGGLSKTLKMIS
jgi:hypothetical protein